jgi:hypothetical protein
MSDPSLNIHIGSVQISATGLAAIIAVIALAVLFIVARWLHLL